MKNILIFTVAILLFSQVNAQSDSNNQTKDAQSKPIEERLDQIKLNGLYLVFGMFEIGYERVLNENSGLGIELNIPFDLNTDINFFLTPHYRMYFGEKHAAGFFGEFHAHYINFEESGFFNSSNKFVSRNNSELALGLGVGGKWITNSGVFFETNIGISRILNISTTPLLNQYFPRLGITAGYRF